jgi:aspartate 1-decarboxylase
MMKRTMLKSKIHRARLTDTRLDYEGSITIDSDLLKAADMLAGEQVHVLNLANGSRIVTYVIEAPAGSGTVMLNGPAARMGMTGDEVIVISYCAVANEESRQWRSRVVVVDEQNRPREVTVAGKAGAPESL